MSSFCPTPDFLRERMKQDPDKILKRLSAEIQVLPRTRKAMLHERLRLKVAEDISTLMVEQEVPIEELALRLRLSIKEARKWIWEKDLTLKELSRLLDVLDSEFFPVITSRKLWRNI